MRKNQTIKVKIPAGIDDGQALNLRGKGNAGLDGGPAGDLLITVFVKPHPLFERDGNSVLMEMPVSFAQAALSGASGNFSSGGGFGGGFSGGGGGGFGGGGGAR